MSNILLWTTSHGHAGVWRSARTYLSQLCTDRGPAEFDGRWRRMKRESQGIPCLWHDIMMIIYTDKRDKVWFGLVSLFRTKIVVLFNQSGSFAYWVECSPMGWETEVQSQRLLKWYLIPPSLTLSIIRHVSRVKWSNPGEGVAPSPTPRCSSYWKGSLGVAFDYGCQ